MPWLFRRRRRPAKFKEARSTDVGIDKKPSTRQRHAPRRRPSSLSMPIPDDMEKKDPFADPSDPFADPPLTKEVGIDSYPRLQHSPHLLPVIPQRSRSAYNLRPRSHPSLPSFRDRSKFQRHQSLRIDPTTESLVRRISSKQNKAKDHDQAREDQVRAMSLKRPAGNSGGMLRRESKKVKGGSDVSLPFQDSIHSSMSGNSDRRAFRVSAFDMFSPRPNYPLLRRPTIPCRPLISQCL